MSKFTASSGFKTIEVHHNVPNVGKVIGIYTKFGGWVGTYFSADGAAETYVSQVTSTSIYFANKAAWGANYKWIVTIKYVKK